MSRLTSTATVCDMLYHATGEILQAFSGGRQSALNSFARKRISRAAHDSVQPNDVDCYKELQGRDEEIAGRRFRAPVHRLNEMDEEVRLEIDTFVQR